MLLAASGATHLFASEFQRTQATLAPLGESLGLAPAIRPARETAALVQELRALPAGSVAVVAGHSNTVPALARELGAELRGLDKAGNLGEAEYGRLFALTLAAPGQPAALLELRYGR